MLGSQESSSVGSRQSTSVSHTVEAESDASDDTIFYPRVLIIDSLFAGQFHPVFSDLQAEQKGRWSLPFRVSRLPEDANGTDLSCVNQLQKQPFQLYRTKADTLTGPFPVLSQAIQL